MHARLSLLERASAPNADRRRLTSLNGLAHEGGS
jgi:hypothetical protein